MEVLWCVYIIKQSLQEAFCPSGLYISFGLLFLWIINPSETFAFCLGPFIRYTKAHLWFRILPSVSCLSTTTCKMICEILHLGLEFKVNSLGFTSYN